MMLMEIALRAELDRYDHPEYQEYSRELCDEEPENRVRGLDELRQLIYERGECSPRRTDDAFLLRFLRARRFIPARAHRMLVRYCQFREQNRHLWEGVDAYALAPIGRVFESTLYDRPDIGRLIVVRIGLWDPVAITTEDLIRAGVLMMEMAVMQPRLQILGGMGLLDLEGFNLQHMRYFTPGLANFCLRLAVTAFPIHIRHCHVVNYTGVLDTFFLFFKRVFPRRLLDLVSFHGSDMDSLHKQIPPSCLPRRYGGTRHAVNFHTYLTKMKSYKDQDFDDELRDMGYFVDN